MYARELINDTYCSKLIRVTQPFPNQRCRDQSCRRWPFESARGGQQSQHSPTSSKGRTPLVMLNFDRPCRAEKIDPLTHML